MSALAELNLIAGRRAKATTAYASALSYFAAGAALLTEDWWELRHELAVRPGMASGGVRVPDGGDDAAESERLAMLSSRAANTVELATVACLRTRSYTRCLIAGDRASHACASTTSGACGTSNGPPHPSQEEVAVRIRSNLEIPGSDRAIEGLIELPLMSDPASLATMDVLTTVVVGPAYFTDENFFALVTCRMINLSIEHGQQRRFLRRLCLLGIIAGPRFGDHESVIDSASWDTS